MSRWILLSWNNSLLGELVDGSSCRGVNNTDKYTRELAVSVVTPCRYGGNSLKRLVRIGSDALDYPACWLYRFS